MKMDVYVTTVLCVQVLIFFALCTIIDLLFLFRSRHAIFSLLLSKVSSTFFKKSEGHLFFYIGISIKRLRGKSLGNEQLIISFELQHIEVDEHIIKQSLCCQHHTITRRQWDRRHTTHAQVSSCDDICRWQRQRWEKEEKTGCLLCLIKLTP